MSLLFQLFTYLYASGGGFSNYFATPDYQKTAVANYLENNPISYNKSLYNSTGTSRGFPDLSANGANYVVSVSITITIRRTNSYGPFFTGQWKISLGIWNFGIVPRCRCHPDSRQRCSFGSQQITHWFYQPYCKRLYHLHF